MKVYRYLALCLFVSVAQSANAVLINYTLEALEGNSYRYEYTITNDGSLLGDDFVIEWFAILFDPEFYDEDSLTIETPEPLASAWDELIFGSGLLIPAAYDVFALADGIAVGDSISGFAVEFAWLGNGLVPGAQDFELYNPETFDIVSTGRTQTSAMSVAEPNTLALLLIPAILLIVFGNVRREVYQAG